MRRADVLLVGAELGLRGVAALLDGEETGLSLRMSGWCSTGTAAVREVEAQLLLKVVLLDLGVEDLPALEVIRRMRRSRPDVAVVARGSARDSTQVYSALRAGARGFLDRGEPARRVVRELREAADGGAPLSSPAARMVVESFAASEPVQPCAGGVLTEREQQVVHLLTKGLTYQETAQVLRIGVGTVQAHVKNIYRKLEVNSKAEATAVVLTRGLVNR